MVVLEILFIDDDKENLEQFRQMVPEEIGGHSIAWEFISDFDEGLRRLRLHRYDLLVSDVYRDRKGAPKNINAGDNRATDLVREIRANRFCPIVLFSDGQEPEGLAAEPFVKYADKSAADFMDRLGAMIGELLQTGVPQIARQLHDDLDRYAGSYLWDFLGKRWSDLRTRHSVDAVALGRIIRRRAALLLGRLDNTGEELSERETADSADYYVYPPAGKDLRLGEIIRRRSTDEFHIVLTPHCHLIVQPNKTRPKADYLLTARTFLAKDQITGFKGWATNPNKVAADLLRRIGLPAQDVGIPEGRYCFLPGFLDVPDLYCDLMRLESLSYDEIRQQFDRIAVLDTPFAEALQATLARLYSAVGLPGLAAERFLHLAPDGAGPESSEK